MIYIGERECTLQRRHQKVVEECPSPVVTEDLRSQFGEMAVRAAKAVNYYSTGTIECLMGADRQFYFLEINNQGEYRFVRASGNNPLNWLILIDWTPSNAILKGYNQTNTFLIVATGSHFSFYINKQLIASSYSDTSGSAYTSGMIGFLVGGDSAGGTEAVFTNVWVFQK